MGIIQKLNEKGWRYSLAIIFNRIVPKWLFRCRRYVIFRLDTNVPPPSRPNTSGVVTSWCETESELSEVEALTYFRRDSIPGKVRAVQAKIDGQVLGGFWAATESFDEEELGVRVVLGPTQTWMFAAYVNPESRGKGIHTSILRFIIQELSESGIHDQFLSVNPNNKPSMRVHNKFAEKQVGKVFAMRFMNCSLCFSSPNIRRGARFTTNSKDRPIEIFLS